MTSNIPPSFVVLIISLVMCSLSLSVVATPNDSQWELFYADEFDGPGLNTTMWGIETGPDTHNGQAQFYTDLSENIKTESGLLHLIALHKPYVGVDGRVLAEYTSGSIFSKAQNFTYGRFEFRARVPAKGRGSWPALWMLGADIEEKPWPWCGEIDVMEAVGFDPDVVHGSYHFEMQSSMRGNQITNTKKIANMSDEFVIYSAEWSPEKIVIAVNGEPYSTYTNNGACSDVFWPYNKPFTVKMNLAVGGNWGKKYGIDNSIFPLSMEIDYFRVYKLKAASPPAEETKSSHSTSWKEELASIEGDTAIGSVCRQFHYFMELNATKVSRWVFQHQFMANGYYMTQLHGLLATGIAKSLNIPQSAPEENVAVHAVSIRPSFSRTPLSPTTIAPFALLVNFSLVNLPPSPGSNVQQTFAKITANKGAPDFISEAMALLNQHAAAASRTGDGAIHFNWVSSACPGCFLPEAGSMTNPPSTSTVPVPSPWHNFILVPGSVVVSEYDFGGPSVGYSDETVWNMYNNKAFNDLADMNSNSSQQAYDRAPPDWVDTTEVVPKGATEAISSVGYFVDGEWLRYSHIVVEKDGFYQFSLSAANGLGYGGVVHVEFSPLANRGNSTSGEPVYEAPKGSKFLPDVVFNHVVSPTGSWITYKDTVATRIYLSKATYTITLSFPPPNNYALHKMTIEFDSTDTTPTPKAQTPPPGDDNGKDNGLGKTGTYVLIAIICLIVVLGMVGIIVYQRKGGEDGSYSRV